MAWETCPMEHVISDVEQLEAIYGTPGERALWKEIDYLNDDYCAFVKASPFVILASIGREGSACSPKGDPAGFVSILATGHLPSPIVRAITGSTICATSSPIREFRCCSLFRALVKRSV